MYWGTLMNDLPPPILKLIPFSVLPESISTLYVLF